MQLPFSCYAIGCSEGMQFAVQINAFSHHMYSIPLYDCLEEAVQVFPEYAGCPMLISLYNALVTQTSTGHELPGQDMPPVFMTNLEVPEVTPERYMQVLEKIGKGRLRKNF